jgi:hypothetical protein
MLENSNQANPNVQNTRFEIAFILKFGLVSDFVLRDSDLCLHRTSEFAGSDYLSAGFCLRDSGSGSERCSGAESCFFSMSDDGTVTHFRLENFSGRKT